MSTQLGTAFLCLSAMLGAACASVHSGEYAKLIQANGQVAQSPVTPAGLLISGREVEDLSSTYFGLLELTFENPTAGWIHVDGARVTFAGKSEEAVVSTTPEIVAWSQSIRQRNAIRRVNTATALSVLAIAGAAGAALSPNRSLAVVAGGTAVAATATLVGTDMAAAARSAEAASPLPESHLLAGSFSVPPGLFVKKWLLVYTQADVPGRCIDRMTLSYQPGVSRWEHVLVAFKVRSSDWQPNACVAEAIVRRPQ